MKKLSNYLTEQRMALEMEEAIVTAWNTKPSYWPRKMTIGRPVADNIVSFLKQQGITGAKAKKVSRKNVKITKNWKKYGATDNTPKTDIKIGTNKISLKTGPRSRLMSGGKNEAQATFYNVINKVEINEDGIISTIGTMLDRWEEKIIGTASLAKEREKGKNQILKEADALHKEMTKVLDDFFQNNVYFRNAFAKEAMSGEIKFGAGSAGSAEYILKVLDPSTGKKNTLNNVDNSSYVGYIGKQMDIRVEWKSTKRKTGKYRYWSVLSLALDKMNEEFDRYEGQELNEGIISSILTKVKLFLDNLIRKVKEYIQQGVTYVMEFLDIEPDINVRTEVKF